MLYKCANPNCSQPFRRLDQGRSFQEETEYPPPSTGERSQSLRAGHPVRRVDRYWLCDDCASFLTLSFEKGQGVVTVPLDSARKNIAREGPGLRSVQRGKALPPHQQLRELALAADKTIAGVMA